MRKLSEFADNIASDFDNLWTDKKMVFSNSYLDLLYWRRMSTQFLIQHIRTQQFQTIQARIRFKYCWDRPSCSNIQRRNSAMNTHCATRPSLRQLQSVSDRIWGNDKFSTQPMRLRRWGRWHASRDPEIPCGNCIIVQGNYVFTDGLLILGTIFHEMLPSGCRN